MHELTMQTFWGTPLALLPSALLLNWVVQLRVAALFRARREGEAGADVMARARLLRKAWLASGFAVSASALAALTSGVCVVFRVAGQMPLLAMQALALLAMIFTSAAAAVEGSAALRAVVEAERSAPHGTEPD
ncbi:MAG: hypothetical protein H6726_00935 [Sandaracinaceae bacterium]|nr:hypothetical protein [Myxococcales bacterium]MCB9656184.1 hypothetical protein [Sandaracinaceae bacterium]